MIALILLLLFIQVSLTATKFRYGAAMMFFILVFFPQDMSLSTSHDISLHKLSILIGFAAMLWLAFFGKDKREGDFRLYYRTPLLFLLLLLPSFLFMGDWGGIGNRIMQMFLNFIVFQLLPGFILFSMIRTREDFRLLCRVLIAAVVMMCLYGLMEMLTNSNPFLSFVKSNRAEGVVTIEYSEDAFRALRYGFTRRIQSTAWHPIAYGGSLSMFLVIIAYYYGHILHKSITSRSLAVYLLVLSNIFLCMSRAPWLATVLSLMVLVMYDWRNISDHIIKKRQTIVFLFCLVLVPAGLYVVYKVYGFMTTHDAYGSTLSMRFDQAAALWELMKSNLLFGFGFNAAVDYMHDNSIQTEVLGFESIFFIYIFDYGFFGLAGLLFLYWSTYRNFSRFGSSGYRDYFLPILVSHIVLVALSGEIRTFRIFWMLYSMMYAAYLLDRKEVLGSLFPVRNRRAVPMTNPDPAAGTVVPQSQASTNHISPSVQR